MSRLARSRVQRGVNWHSRSVEEIQRALKVDPEHGLTAEEAGDRLKRTGPNQLQQTRRVHGYQILIRQFTSVLILILVVAVALSVVIGAYIDALVILAIVLLNGGLGFAQEWKAERAIAALRSMLQPKARVLRDGRVQEIPAREVVPGDVVVLEPGDRVPADVRLSEAAELNVDEAVLTGESVPVLKHVEPVDFKVQPAEQGSMGFMGSMVTAGRGRGIVVATGMKTVFGRIAHLTSTVVEERTPLQKKLARLGRQLGGLAVLVSVVIAGAGWWIGRPWLDMVMTGISLAVAVVPEGLPAVVTITLALGIRTMVRRNVLLRKLSAAEAVGAATVICTDKTGTLTQNQMTVQEIWTAARSFAVTGAGYEPRGTFEVEGEQIDARTEEDLLALLETGCVCNHAELSEEADGWHGIGDPTEAALLVAALKAEIPAPTPVQEAEFSFTSERKRMTVVTRDEEGGVAHVKGAPEVVLARCTQVQVGGQVREFSEEDRQVAEAAYRRMAGAGRRTLALARRSLEADVELNPEQIEDELTLLGLVSIQDPPRPEVAEAVTRAREAGIRVIMITGDAPETALAVAQSVGLEDRHALTGPEFAGLSDQALSTILHTPVVFARTTPEHKLRIVTLLQAQGEIVGMTGDGVNDAPALKKADIGIAMGKRGTDVAQQAADMVLTDDHFASIINGVEEGRHQFDNILKFVRYLLTSNTGEVLAIFANMLLGGPLVLLPVQILWMNLVTDGLTAVALGVEPVESDAMERPPRDPRSPILGRAGALVVALIGTYLGAATLFLFYYILDRDGSDGLVLAQTVAFTGLVVMEKVNVFNFRSLRRPLFKIGWFSNPWLLLAVAGTLALQVTAVYWSPLQQALHTTALGWSDWGLIVLVALPVFIVPELVKGLMMGVTRNSSLRLLRRSRQP